MKTIGQPFPAFRLEGVVSNELADGFPSFQNPSADGQWGVFVFYPKDFTFVCPTELAGFGKLNGEFADRDAKLFAVSTDSAFVHRAWRESHEDLRELPYPMLSDQRRELAEELGVLDPDELVCTRATFVVDPQGIIRYAAVNDGSVGRSPEEVLRVLDALQTGELCPCNWQRGESTLEVA